MPDQLLAPRIREHASTDQREALSAAVQVASGLGMPIYLVGGATRDLLLTGRFRDLDLVIEGDGLEFANRLAERLAANVGSHHRFLTAEIVRNDLLLDVATARTEVYRRPAELPEVAAGSLEEDLARRDFTINAMAVELWPEADGSLIDPFGGQADLEQGLLRVLHDRSFIDDPTRILRGARLAARLDFRWEPQTERLALAAVEAGAFDPLSASRLRQELVLALEDEAVDACLRQLEALGVLGVLHERWKPGPSAYARLRRLAALASRWQTLARGIQPPARPWVVHLMSILEEQDGEVLSAVADRLQLERDLVTLVTTFSPNVSRAAQLLAGARVQPSEVHRALRDLAAEELMLLWLREEEPVRRWTERWLGELRHLRLTIGGDELLARGVAPGPRIGRALEMTLAARLDGGIGPDEELEFAVDQALREPAKLDSGGGNDP